MLFFLRNIFLLVGISTLLLLQNKSVAQNQIIRDGEPTIIIHDTIASPGELLLQLDAMNFVDENGQVAAITLRIEVDTFLIDFINIQNVALPGSWLANYNTFLNEITITYTAPFGMGFDVNGKLLDLQIVYFGGFPADFTLKSGCDVTNINLQEIVGIVYTNGRINQGMAEGMVMQDSLVAYYNQSFSMPVMAGGSAYDMVDKLQYLIDYDPTQLVFESVTESAIANVLVSNESSILTIDWEDTISTFDFSSMDTLFYLNFLFIGDTNTTTNFLPGSRMYNDGLLIASEFIDGHIRGKFLVELLNSPDTSGSVLGGGYYFPGESVTIVAVPEPGFHFSNWSLSSDTVSTDSMYTFVKQYSNDTLTAYYTPNVYNLNLLSSPEEGGEVLGAGSYVYNETVTATAVPSEGYEFLCWKNDGVIVSFDLAYTFPMPIGDISLTAHFETLVFSVTAVSNNIDYGVVEGGGDFTFGETATLIATPNDNYKFVVWTEEGEVASYDAIYSFNVYTDRNLVANFQLDIVCSAPVGLFADGNSETTALLHWFSSGNEGEWDLLWGEVGFDTISDGTLVEGLAETQYLLENLDPGTLYDFYVRAVCTDEIHSPWAGPETFATWYVGIDKQKEQLSVVVYPNPVTNTLFVKLPENEMLKNYRIISALGVIQSESKKASVGQFSIQLNDLPQGVYFLQLLLTDQSITQVIIKE